jgi:hypothetical protein
MLIASIALVAMATGCGKGSSLSTTASVGSNPSSGSSGSSGSGPNYPSDVNLYDGDVLIYLDSNEYTDSVNGDLIFYQGGGLYKDTTTGDEESGPVIDGFKVKAAACSTVEQCAAQAQPFNQAVANLSAAEGAPNSVSDSVGGGTADIQQQQAAIAQQDQASRAQNFADSFQMNYNKALQLTQLSDQVKAMSANGQMTDEDRAAVTDQALGVAQISSAEVNAAAADAIKNGDTSSIDALVDKAATNLGMPNDQSLKDKLLPALGLSFQ